MKAPRCSSNLFCPCAACKQYWAAVEALEPSVADGEDIDYEAEKAKDTDYAAITHSTGD